MENKFQQEMSAIQKALEAIASLDEAQRPFAVETIIKRLGISIGSQPGNPTSSEIQSPSTPLNTNLSPKQFLAMKKPKTEVEQILCLAFYLTHYRQQQSFKTSDLTKLNTEAAAPKISNPNRSADNASRQNFYLASAGAGKKQVTSFGEEIVNAMPDRQAVAQVISQNKPKKSRRTKSNTKSK